MTPQERVAAIDLALAGNRPLVWSQNGVNFRADQITRTADGSGLTCTVSAWTGQGSAAVPLPTDNPYIVVNPPTKVPDGETTVTIPPARPGLASKTLVVAAYRSDPVAAYREALTSAVLHVARERGWTG